MPTTERMYPYPKGFTRTPRMLDLLAGPGGGCGHFNGLLPAEAAAILAEAPALSDDRQNDAPSFSELVALAARWPGMTFHGYRIGVERDDERITLEGFNHPQAKKVCKDEGLSPDELDSTRAWWD